MKKSFYKWENFSISEKINLKANEDYFKKNDYDKLLKKYKTLIRLYNNNDDSTFSLTFIESINKFFWNKKTKKNIISLFEEYQNYINGFNFFDSSKILNERKNKETDQFFKEENIINFLLEHKKYANTTFNNRLGLFRRIIRIMLKNPVWDYINYSVNEKKEKLKNFYLF